MRRWKDLIQPQSCETRWWWLVVPILLIKLRPILALSPVVLTVLVVIGTMTAIGASMVAIAQIDIKRALSHSTSAYLGLVFIAVGMQWPAFALLLLFTHAIAKALCS